MNPLGASAALLIGSVSALYLEVPEQMLTIYEESLLAAQQVMTAGDMHSMSVMLGARYIMDHNLPAEDQFEDWLRQAFQENNIKDLALDHWGRPYLYRLSDDRRTYQLSSLGPDGVAGTSDDMSIHGP